MLDSDYERLALKALPEGIPPGHYQIKYVEELAPSQHSFGPGRVFIEDLRRRDISALLTDEKAEATLDDDRLRIGHRVATIGLLGAIKGVSIHGGGATLSGAMAKANFQPLTSPGRGVRVHNIDLCKLMKLLLPRLICQQLIVLTICT